MHGGELLVQTLIQHRVSHVFGVPGGQANAFYDALSTHRGEISHVLVRDERSAAYAADGFARVTNRLGVCDATVGPGALKLPSGLMEAYNSSIPILGLVSDHARNAVLLQDRGRISQGGDQAAVLRPFCKEVLVVPSTELIPDVVAAAVNTAVSGRPGPVIVEIPEDVFNGGCEASARAGDTRFPKFRCVPPRSDIERAVAVLTRARRPLVLAGGGVHISGAADQIGRIAARLGAAIATTMTGKGAVVDTDPRSVGVLGDFGNPSAKALADAADVIISVGYKNSQMASFGWTIPRAGQSLVHIDIDPIELGRLTSTAVGLWGDARETMEVLLSALTESSVAPDPEWTDLIRSARDSWRSLMEREGSEAAEPIWPQAVARRVSAARRSEDYIVFDASFSSGWGAAFVESTTTGRRMLFPRGAAGLGYSVPAALGVALAVPESHVICLAGDGAAGYFLAELGTIAARKLPVTCIVLNNSCLGWARVSQRLSQHYRGEAESVELGQTDYAAIARGLGVDGATVTSVRELDRALAAALEAARPSLISIVADRHQVASFGDRERLNHLPVEGRGMSPY